MIDLNAPILPGVTKQLSHITVSVDEVVDILRSLVTKKAKEHDKLSTIVLKECADFLAPSVTAMLSVIRLEKKQLYLQFFKKGKESLSKIIA